jgi:hypothetical protein
VIFGAYIAAIVEAAAAVGEEMTTFIVSTPTGEVTVIAADWHADEAWLTFLVDGDAVAVFQFWNHFTVQK